MNLEAITNNFYQLLYKECSNLITNICTDSLLCANYNELSSLENYLREKYIPSKLSLSSSTNIKQKLPSFERCSAIKKDSEQCTRRRRDGKDFCGKHINRHPYGVVSENNKKNDDYISVTPEIFNGEEYLIDSENNVYTNDLNMPHHIGTKIATGELVMNN